MGKYILKRIVQFIPVFFGVTFLLFAMRVIVPGDPVIMIAGERAVSPATYQLIVERNHLDEPIYVQYGYYMNDLLHGDFGHSYQKGRDVKVIFADKFPYTARLAVAAISVEVLFGISVGIVSAIKKYSFIDMLLTLSTSILVSMPVFWLGLMLQAVFGIWLKRVTGGLISLPISGAGGPISNYPAIVHLILPAITLASVSLAVTARIMRSQLLEVLSQDYIRTAYAKGLAKRDVIIKHALKNAMIPVITFIGIDFGSMMSGAILTESVFSWPGIGREIYLAITARDWPIVMGGVVIIVIIVMLINLIIDISYALFDPRIRYGANRAE
ncbi:MAG: ABC transporter permease [Coriobacteriia bacterium]|nr:ABC transporter permease [Coriobacteriia bacterium]